MKMARPLPLSHGPLLLLLLAASGLALSAADAPPAGADDLAFSTDSTTVAPEKAIGLDGVPCACKKDTTCSCPQKPFFVPGENDPQTPCEKKRNTIYWRSLLRGQKNWPEMGPDRPTKKEGGTWFQDGTKWRFRWYEPKNALPGGCGGEWEDPTTSTTTTTTSTTTTSTTSTTTATIIVYDDPPTTTTTSKCNNATDDAKDKDGEAVPPKTIKSPPAPPKDFMKDFEDNWETPKKVKDICNIPPCP